MITFLILFLFFICFLIVPGYLLARKATENFLGKIFISFGVSVVAVTAISFIEGFFKIPYLLLVLIIVTSLIFILKGYYKDFFRIQIKLSNLDYLNIGLIFLGLIFQGLILFKTGKIREFGVGFWGPLGRDGVWHQAVISQLLKSVPPENPGFSGNTLFNYHYFYDLLVAKTFQITAISVSALLYRFYPILISIFLGIGTYLLSINLFKKREVSFFVLFFTYFGSSFGWIVEYFRSKTWGGESAFWANQPVSLNINPPFAISLVFFILLLYLFLEIQNKNMYAKFSFVLIGASLIGFKVYAGVVFLVGLFIISTIEIIRSKNFQLFKIFTVTAFFSFIIFLSQVRGANSLIELHPFWLIDSMVDLTDRVGWLKLSSARSTYFAEKNWLKYFAAEVLSLIIFLVGNLGTRIVGLPEALKEFRKKFRTNNLYSLIFICSAVSFALTLIFVQKGNPWNIIQFFYYFMYFAALFAGSALYKIFEKKNIYSIGIIALILFITPISSWSTFKSGFYPKPPAFVSSKELSALEFLSNLDKVGSILTHPFDSNYRSKFSDPYPLFAYAPSAYVSAYSKKAVYLEDVEQQMILNTNFKDRLLDSERFFVEKDLRWSNKFLKEKGIAYIYLPKSYQLPMAEEEYQMKKVFENEEVNIYEVK